MARVAIVTGAGAGIGAAAARRLAADGLAVLVNNRRHPDRPSSADAVAADIVAAGGRALADGHAVDAPDAARGIVAGAVSAFGRLDALLLNAGISGPAVKVGAGATDLAIVMAINFTANAALVEAALPHLLASPAGRIVLISSAAGLYGVRGRAAYAASKGALNAWGLSLAAELARTPVRVNIVAPYAATKMTTAPDDDVDPRLSPERIAPVIAWFASPDCAVTGGMWVTAGGIIRRAGAVESEGVPFAPAALPDLETHRHAEAAFARFHATHLTEDRCPD